MSRSIQPQQKTLPTQAGPPEQPAETTSALQSLLQELRTRGNSPALMSMLGANFNSAVEALWANRTRSILTALGIFIGVAAVISALTLTQGVNAYINNLISVGTNTIIISPGASNRGGISQGLGSFSTLTSTDATALTHIPHIINVSPILITGDKVIYGNQSWDTQVEGATTDLQAIQNWQMASGSWFSQADDSGGEAVAVIGDTVSHNLFDASSVSPIGQRILVRNQIFRVVGVLTPQGGAFAQDDVVIIPIKAMQTRLNNTTSVSQILAQVDASTNVDQAQKDITAQLRQDHHLRPADTSDFQTITSVQILQRANQGTAVLSVLLVGIAGISLTVGGIGIMNIMLVSVTERTWEIGIRMSIGARRKDIRNQFLIEALVLCLAGGVIGMTLGLLVGWAVVQAAGLPFVITPTTIILPIAVSSAIALLFGLYPAIRASRLDPIAAIRTEE